MRENAKFIYITLQYTIEMRGRGGPKRPLRWKPLLVEIPASLIVEAGSPQAPAVGSSHLPPNNPPNTNQPQNPNSKTRVKNKIVQQGRHYIPSKILEECALIHPLFNTT